MGKSSNWWSLHARVNWALKKNGGFIDHHLLRYIYDCHYESNNNSNSNSHHPMIFTSVIALYMTGAADTSFASHSMLCSLD